MRKTAELIRAASSPKSKSLRFIVTCLLFSCLYITLTPTRFGTQIGLSEKTKRREKFLVCFHASQIGRRGTDVAVFDYAQTLLLLGGDRYAVRFIVPKHAYLNAIQNAADVKLQFESAFGPFEVYDALIAGWEASAQTGNSMLGGGLANSTRKLGCKMLYTLKAGARNDPPTFPQNLLRIPWAVHAVFTTNEPHGYVFAAVSLYLAKHQGPLKRCNGSEDVYVDHIVDLPLEEKSMDIPLLRNQGLKKYGIPSNAKLVLCRLGGSSTFDIDFVRESLSSLIETNPGVHIILLNTDRLSRGHPRIHEFEGVSTVEGKAIFFATCDAMLHARTDGETFGLAVAEFSLRNKPVITFNGRRDGYERAHLEMLSDKGLYYHDLESLNQSISRLIEGFPPHTNWNAYSAFSRDAIFSKFERVFIAPALAWWDGVEKRGVNDVWAANIQDIPKLAGPPDGKCW